MTDDQRPVGAESVLAGPLGTPADRATDSASATRLMLAMLDGDDETASRVLSEASAVPLLKGLLGWALAFGERAARGDRSRLRRLLQAELGSAFSRPGGLS